MDTSGMKESALGMDTEESLAFARRSRVQRSPPQQFHTPKAIWTKNVADVLKKVPDIGVPVMAPVNVEEAVPPSSAPAVIPVNPFDYSGATADKSALGVDTSDLRFILTTLVEKSSELSKMLRDARYLNKDMKELAQKVVRLQKSALHSFDANYRRHDSAVQQSQETQWSPQQNGSKRQSERPAKNSPKRKKGPGAPPAGLAVPSQQSVTRRTENDAPPTAEWTKVKGRQAVRKLRPRPDAIIIEPTEKMTYSEILNLVTRNQDDKLKSVGESVRMVKCTAKGALLLQLNDANPESTQQLRDNIGSVLEGKVQARALTQQTRLEVLDLDEMVTVEDLQKVFKEQIGVSLDVNAIKSLRPAFGGTQRAIISLPTTLATKVLSVGKIRIAWPLFRPTSCAASNYFVRAKLASFWIYSCYYPPTLNRYSFAAAIDELVEDAIDHKPAVIAGDFNAWAQEWGSDISKRSSSDAIGKGDALLEAFAALDVVLLNHGTANTFNRGGAGSVIDLTFVTSSLSHSATWRMCNHYTASDHEALVFSLGNRGGRSLNPTARRPAYRADTLQVPLFLEAMNNMKSSRMNRTPPKGNTEEEPMALSPDIVAREPKSLLEVHEQMSEVLYNITTVASGQRHITQFLRDQLAELVKLNETAVSLSQLETFCKETQTVIEGSHARAAETQTTPQTVPHPHKRHHSPKNATPKRPRGTATKRHHAVSA
ncbi:hypothetical protein ACLKA7_000745 [Drosophila subpalustris]